MQPYTNLLIDTSVLATAYNIIHWILGLNLLLFAVFEYTNLRKAANGKRFNLVGPYIYLFNGIFFILYLFLGHIIYLGHYQLWWQFETEHKIHLLTGLAFALGGVSELLSRLKILTNTHWRFGLPLSLIAAGALFLHPQHGFGDVLVYMTSYHRVLAAALILSGVSMAFVIVSGAKTLKLVPLLFILISGTIFLAYRHKYNLEATCRIPGKKHEVLLSSVQSEPVVVRATLCDQLVFTSGSEQAHHIQIGGHSHAGHHPELSQTVVNPMTSQSLGLSVSGAFTYSDHLNPAIYGKVIVEKPANLSGWTVREHE